jgi:photosystem II stability/assembly factor-like uncharacterized protein
MLALGWALPYGVAAEATLLQQAPAVASTAAKHAAMHGVGKASQRMVAVGDHGIVLLSDDDGKTFRQARHVPTSATLTSVSFVDAKNGWAAGHWGVILHTSDGGETWTLQRDETSADRPLFSICFQDAQTGLAVGLWGLVLRTENGGKTWSEITLPVIDGHKSDKNLFSVFRGPSHDLFIAAEHGTVLHADPDSTHFVEVQTGGAGSLWAGITLRSGVILLGGLRGKVYRSTDGGTHWQQVDGTGTSSITGFAQSTSGQVMAVGLDGAVLVSDDDGVHFQRGARQTQVGNTAVAAGANGFSIFTMAGVEPYGATLR